MAHQFVGIECRSNWPSPAVTVALEKCGSNVLDIVDGDEIGQMICCCERNTNSVPLSVPRHGTQLHPPERTIKIDSITDYSSTWKMLGPLPPPSIRKRLNFHSHTNDINGVTFPPSSNLFLLSTPENWLHLRVVGHGSVCPDWILYWKKCSSPLVLGERKTLHHRLCALHHRLCGSTYSTVQVEWTAISVSLSDTGYVLGSRLKTS